MRADAPLLLLAQGHAGDRLGARLVPALRSHFPDFEIAGMGGERMAAAGVRLVGRSEGISVMGYSGLLPAVPAIFRAIFGLSLSVRRQLPAAVIAVDVWQPLQVLHRWAPALKSVPHVCYLPPAPNLIGRSRVHSAVSQAFDSIVTAFPHQERLYREAGGRTRMAAHAGLQTCREEAQPLAAAERQPVLALLPGSRELEIRASLDGQVEAARLIRRERPDLTPVVGCASEAVARQVEHRHPGLQTELNARRLLGRARFALICSGTAVLEAALLGCPGVVTYAGSRLQRLEWHRVHVPRLARLRAAGIASPYVALPNILAGEELYPELLDRPPPEIAAAALRGLENDPEAARASLNAVAARLCWDDAGEVVAEEVGRLLKR